MTEPREIRVFVASPDDVQTERERVERVVARLNSEFVEAARFRAIRWETSFYRAHKTFQAQIPEAKDCDIVLVIFGNKLGSELPAGFTERLHDNAPYPSGTAYELLSSVESADAHGRPDVFVFRKTTEPTFGLSQQDEFAEANREKERLDAFFQKWFRTPSRGFTRSFHGFADPDGFEEQTDAMLRQWAGAMLTPARAWNANESPFRGLKAFDARHSKVFFGRRRKVQRALDELLRAHKRESGRPFLLVVGPSGAGKSSLVRAGLIPRLVAPGVVPMVDLWRTAVMRPGAGGTVFAALAQALYVRANSPYDTGGFGAALPELAVGPYKTPQQLVDVLEATRASVAAPIVAALDTVGEVERQKGGFSRVLRTDLLLLVDQLEEIFASSVPSEQRVAFSRLLSLLADSGRVWIVATLRADLYIQMLDPKASFLALKDTGGSYDLASPGEAELREILERSAEAAGLVYDRHPETGEGLDEVLLRDATGSDTLPLLQFSLERLYERREITETATGPQASLTFAAYEALGGMDGAINKVAENAVSDPESGLGMREIEYALPRLIRRFAEPVRERQDATTGLAGLTARAIPLAEATPDDSARTLVDVLVQARLLVTASATGKEPSVRLAHERVLSSWERARKIVQTHREFFRVKADIAIEESRWAAGRQRRELLMSGVPLLEAEGVVKDYGDELSQRLRDYVALSGRHARRRQRLKAAVTSVMFIVGMVALAFGLLAYAAEQKASLNYAAAKDAADTLVSSVPQALGNQTGISSKTVDGVLTVVGKLIDAMEQASRRQQNLLMRQFEAGFAKAEAFIPGAMQSGNEVQELERSRSNMLYEFAVVYHHSANDLGTALAKAQASLAIRQLLVDQGDTSLEARAAVAMGQMELGDLIHIKIDQQGARPGPNSTPLDFAPVRALFAPALATLEGITKQFPDDARWARAYAQITTRMGDLERSEGHLDGAAAWYSRAQVAGLQVFRARSTESTAIKEFAMTFRKMGDLEVERMAFSDAVEAYSKDVCIRRHLVALNPTEISWPEDLTWSLAKLGDAKAKSKPPDLVGAQDADYEAMELRLVLTGKDSSRKAFFSEFAMSLEQIGILYTAEGAPEQSGAFASAAADVRRKLVDAFPDEAKQPPDQPARSMVLRQAQLLRERGAMAMIDGSGRWTVETLNEDFVRNRLPDLIRESDGCWERLLATGMGETSLAARTH